MVLPHVPPPRGQRRPPTGDAEASLCHWLGSELRRAFWVPLSPRRPPFGPPRGRKQGSTVSHAWKQPHP